jgi:hypothetical protein
VLHPPPPPTKPAVARLVRQAVAQGFPGRVTDPVVLARIAKAIAPDKLMEK